MSKLRNKLFAVLMAILTLSAATIIVGINIQQYNAEYKATEQKLTVIETNRGGDFRQMPEEQTEQVPENIEGADNGADNEASANIGNEVAPHATDDFNWNKEEIRFIDAIVYSVLLNSDNTVSEVIHHSNSSKSDQAVKKIAEAFLAEHNENVNVVGNLYSDRYAFSLVCGQELTIIDNSDVNTRLKNLLKLSIGIFILIEILFIIISKLLVKWLVKPVQESFDKQKQFVADASHELKTPITVIMASADAYSDSHEEKWLDNIKSESERMDKLVKNLLDLAKSEDAIDSMVLEEGNLSKTVEKAALSCEALMFEKGLILDCDIEDNVKIPMDADRIEELCIILLDNAMKHSVNGGHINVSLKNNAGIHLTVTNEGDAIPAGEEERIFERFYRSDESRNRDQNRYGLGLAIARNIVLGHNGHISARSSEGHTSFDVKFN